MDPTSSKAAGELARAVELLGGQAAVARLVGVAQPSVWKWLRRGKHLPGEHVLKLEKALQEIGSPINRHDLRPDLYPREDHAVSHDTATMEPAR
ncbi:YdaS family helix-turn-helix protein [Sphingomonas sp. BK580]|uniref:YdaS family helix-turn-helix protein n=1 Tax=Sphingomonas sp. BK580 TaxID=2586972 RepID=UPI00160978D7|nr:YdaS family helix-turn-helix protein [Sphingomonas sp. BK580]MBB3691476.1 DNA-binding transcriptional regulator YdaS (Cro superfamily) [Sphingomonas sp. BK580]